MRGLVRNNFYSLGSNLQLSFVVATFLMFVPIVIGEETLIPMVLAIQSFIFIANSGSALNVDITSKWSNFEITLPVKRSDIVKARYISFSVLLLFGLFFSVITSIFTAFVFQTISVNTLASGIMFGVSLSLITAALMYPIMLKIGTEKNEIIIFICAGIAVGIYMLIVLMLSPFSNEAVPFREKPLVNIVCTISAVVLFYVSYFVSLAMYKRKEL